MGAGKDGKKGGKLALLHYFVVKFQIPTVSRI
jgi:hypothetical protein